MPSIFSRPTPFLAVTLVAATFAFSAPAVLSPSAPTATSAAPEEPAPITAAGDGPYVVANGPRWLAKRVGSNLRPILETVEPRGRIRVAPVGDVPAFTVKLRPLVGTPAADTLALAPHAKLLVLADTHGEYEIVHAFLRKQGVIDAKMKWAFGKGQLVVTGDMFDRGAHQLEILWLFYKLEAEARKAGGALHILIGNHEAMVLRGDLRYLHPRYPEAAAILGAADYAALFGGETILGEWLRSRPAVLKLGDLLLMHGGISPAIVDAKLGVADLNAGIRTALATSAAASKSLDGQTALIAGSSGPQWYRGYFGKGEQQPPAAEIDRSLSAFGVKRILVGHTPVEKVTALYGGKVIAVQVYPHRDETSGAPVLEGALREKGEWYRVGATGLREELAIAP
ncbi:metallophosphoesterase [Sphingopyxis fribergensis]